MSKWVRTVAIQSDSKPDLFYQVGVTQSGEYGCSCPAWKFQRKRLGGECKHIRQVKLMDATGRAQVARFGVVPVVANRIDRDRQTEILKRIEQDQVKLKMDQSARVGNRPDDRDAKKVAKVGGNFQWPRPSPAPVPEIAVSPSGRPRRMVLLDEE